MGTLRITNCKIWNGCKRDEGDKEHVHGLDEIAGGRRAGVMFQRSATPLYEAKNMGQ